jgi:hypothetical protein
MSQYVPPGHVFVRDLLPDQRWDGSAPYCGGEPVIRDNERDGWWVPANHGDVLHRKVGGYVAE